MNITDPIADLLTRIRNAQAAGLEVVSVPASKLKIGRQTSTFKPDSF